MTTRELCKHCGSYNPMGFQVSKGIWLAVVPLEFQDKVICLSCFCNWGDNALVEWDKSIKFFPISLVTSLESEKRGCSC